MSAAADPHARLFDLGGRRAFVAGGYGAIGSAICKGLVAAGAAVVIAGRNQEKSATFASALAQQGHTAYGIAMDGCDLSAVRRAVDDAAQRLGGIDILVNCIGFNQEQRIEEVTEQMFDDMYRGNIRPAMFLAQAVARHQIAGGRGGAQVHLLSVRAQLGMRGYGYSAYCANKGALVMLVKQHAVELAQHGITVNGVAPTVVQTEMASAWLTNPARREALLARIPLGRVAEPDDIVGAALFFCSPASRFVTGQVLYVDGGLTATQ